MEAFHCRSREMWHVPVSDIVKDLTKALTSLCSINITTRVQDSTVIIASCNECIIRISIKNKINPGMEALFLGVPSSIVYVDIDYRGGCLEVCKRLDLALFRGGG